METIDAGLNTAVVPTPVRDNNGAGYQGMERRRPGRPQHISPHLVALLRDDERHLPSAPVVVEARRALMGLGIAVLLSVPLWLMLGVIAWALLG